jgi:hypothetical protein
MKKILSIIAIVTIFVACNTNSSENTENKKPDNNKKQEAYSIKGYQLMQQKCFVCHMEKPDPSNKASMIAPPMMMVQKHYKPTYKNKDEFVNAIAAFVSNPDEKKALMPGAVRKFNLMPNLGYDKDEIKLIAETLFDIDFGNMPKTKMEHSGSLSLNNGEKWKLKPESMEAVNSIIEKLNSFQSEDVDDYNQLGKEIFDHAKTILLDTDYKGALLDQVHFFFGSVEGNIHALEATESIDEAKMLVEKMKKQFAEFDKYFEAE